jgi:hypothetical protein
MEKGILITADKDAQGGKINLHTEIESFNSSFRDIGGAKIEWTITMIVKNAQYHEDVPFPINDNQIYIKSTDETTIPLEANSQKIFLEGSHESIMPVKFTFGVTGSGGKVGGPGFSVQSKSKAYQEEK